MRVGHSALNPPVDFSPNESHNKSKNNMVARGITYQETNALPVVYLNYYLLVYHSTQIVDLMEISPL